MKNIEKRQRILKVEKRADYKLVEIVRWRGKYIWRDAHTDTFYTVHTKKGCVAQNVSKKSFNAIPQPGMFIRLCKNKKQYEITGRNGR